MSRVTHVSVHFTTSCQLIAKPIRPEEAVLRKLRRHSGCWDCGCDVLQILWDSILLKNLHLLLLNFFQGLPIFAWMRNERALNQVEHPVHGLPSILLPGPMPVTRQGQNPGVLVIPVADHLHAM